jgi:L-ribulokinase
MCAAGAFKSVEEAQKKMCLEHTTFEPNPNALGVYERLYGLYRKVYFALGLRDAVPANLGDVLPELRIIAEEARRS